LLGYAHASVEVASFCSLPLGVVFWQTSEPMLTVVVKATFSLMREGEAPLAQEQERLSLDVPDPLGDAAGLKYASDFVPKKARADVIVVGHAHAPEPATSIPVRITIDVLDKQFVARSGEPVRKIPLVPRHLRATTEPTAPAVTVGARAAWAPERLTKRFGVIGPDGIPAAPLGDRFDYQFFNAAPPDQQLNLLRPNGSILLEGLMPGAPRRHVWLPGHRPRVFYYGASGPGPRAAEVPLVSDTLWIDTDRGICTITWRGALALARAGEPPTVLVLSLEPRGAAQSWTTLRDLLGAAIRTRAVEARDLRVPEPLAPVEDPVSESIVEVTAHELPDDDDDERETPRDARIDAAELSAARAKFSKTQVLADPDEEQVPTQTGFAPKRSESPEPPEARGPEKEDAEAASTAPPASMRGLLARGLQRPADTAPLVGAAPPKSEIEVDLKAQLPRMAIRAPMDDEESTFSNLKARARVIQSDDTDTVEEDARDKQGVVTRTVTVPDAVRASLGLPFRAGQPADTEELGEGEAPKGPRPIAQLAFWGAPPKLPEPSSGPGADDEGDERTPAPAPGKSYGIARAPTLPFTKDSPPLSGVEATGVIDLQRVRQQAVPFRGSGDAAKEEGTGLIDPERIRAEAVPFRQADPSAPAPLAAPSTAPSPRRVPSPEDVTRSIPMEALRTPAVPFQDPDQPAGDTAQLAPRLAVPALGVEPPPAPIAPPPEAPGDDSMAPTEPPAAAKATPAQGALLELEKYAGIKAQIWAGAKPLPILLEEHKLTEVDWLEQERRYGEALAQESNEGKSDLARKVRAAIEAARDQLAKDGGDDMSLDEFADLRAAVEASANPSSVLKERGVSEASWRNIRRRFQKRVQGDPALGAELRKKLDAARAARAAR
jgi:hypothetical protein